jgi:erythromycin esterase-like protein
MAQIRFPRRSRSNAGFKRFPTWMWRKADVLAFVGWLREFHKKRLATNRDQPLPTSLD